VFSGIPGPIEKTRFARRVPLTRSKFDHTEEEVGGGLGGLGGGLGGGGGKKDKYSWRKEDKDELTSFLTASSTPLATLTGVSSILPGLASGSGPSSSKTSPHRLFRGQIFTDSAAQANCLREDSENLLRHVEDEGGVRIRPQLTKIGRRRSADYPASSLVPLRPDEATTARSSNPSPRSRDSGTFPHSEELTPEEDRLPESQLPESQLPEPQLPESQPPESQLPESQSAAIARSTSTELVGRRRAASERESMDRIRRVERRVEGEGRREGGRRSRGEGERWRASQAVEVCGSSSDLLTITRTTLLSSPQPMTKSSDRRGEGEDGGKERKEHRNKDKGKEKERDKGKGRDEEGRVPGHTRHPQSAGSLSTLHPPPSHSKSAPSPQLPLIPIPTTTPATPRPPQAPPATPTTPATSTKSLAPGNNLTPASSLSSSGTPNSGNSGNPTPRASDGNLISISTPSPPEDEDPTFINSSPGSKRRSKSTRGILYPFLEIFFQYLTPF
jgi:hypothetical protein